MKNSCAVRSLVLLACSTSIAFAQGYLINTLPGNFPQPLTQATQTITDNPRAVAIVASGNVYFIANNLVYKINQDGTVTRVAGTLRHATNTHRCNPKAIQANLNQPSSLAINSAPARFILQIRWTTSSTTPVRPEALRSLPVPERPGFQGMAAWRRMPN